MWLSRLAAGGAWPGGDSGCSCACARPGSVPGTPSPLSVTPVAASVQETPPPEAVPGSGSGGWVGGVGIAREVWLVPDHAALVGVS